ncbi:hypothetical protein QBC39DRAFT_398293 [Podospora conica]|nr:hypothetical protein QBC39DRAFT_398293 [Schizothecium conicum]
MAPHFFSPARFTILLPRDTPPDPSTPDPSKKGPNNATALHIVLGFVIVGLFISVLAWMKHKFSNPSLARHTHGGPSIAIPRPSSPPKPPIHGAAPRRPSSPPPFPHPRRGINHSQPPPRPIHPPPLVTNEETFASATPRREPAERRHDSAGARRHDDASLTSPPPHAPQPIVLPAPAPAPTFQPTCESSVSASAATARSIATPHRRGFERPGLRWPVAGSRFLVSWHPSLSRHLSPSLFPVLAPFRFPGRWVVRYIGRRR